MLNIGFSTRKSARLSKKEYNKTVLTENYATKVEMFKTIGKEKKINYKKLMNPEKSKQEKVRRDTWRRAEMPSKEDDILNNLHYANFLGDKYGDNGSPYNTNLQINLKFCDSMRDTYEAWDEEEEEESYVFVNQRAGKRLREDNDEDIIPQAKRARTDDESNNV